MKLTLKLMNPIHLPFDLTYYREGPFLSLKGKDMFSPIRMTVKEIDLRVENHSRAIIDSILITPEEQQEIREKGWPCRPVTFTFTLPPGKHVVEVER